jgi:TPR repeat protein
MLSSMKANILSSPVMNIFMKKSAIVLVLVILAVCLTIGNAVEAELSRRQYANLTTDDKVSMAVSLLEKKDPDDYNQVYLLLKDAAEEGNPIAEFNMGMLYFTGKGVPKSNEAAAAWFRKAAEKGDTTAQYNLGNMFGTGVGVAEDASEARKWFTLAADAGHIMASNNVGALFWQGRGGEKDVNKAMYYIKRAGDRGFAQANYFLGLVYLKGNDGVPSDPEMALLRFFKAAQEGDLDSQYNIACMYLKGIGVPVDHKSAFLLFKSAAEKGHAGSQYMTGYMYGKELGVERDLGKSMYWVGLAAKQKFPEAVQSMERFMDIQKE